MSYYTISPLNYPQPSLYFKLDSSKLLFPHDFHLSPFFLYSPFPHPTHITSPCSPALRGLGTPPTNTVLRGSSGREASRTKSASESLQGRICTGLSLMVGEETHRYSLSSSWMQASISCCTLLSSWMGKPGSQGHTPLYSPLCY